MTKYYLTPLAGVLLREPEDGGGGLREVVGPVQGQAQVGSHMETQVPGVLTVVCVQEPKVAVALREGPDPGDRDGRPGR